MSAKMMPQRKPRFSEAIKTKGYQSLIYNTLGDPSRAQRFIASITSAVAVNGQLQECDAGSILAGALLGESLGLQPSPQLGQYYLVPFDCKVKGPDGKALYKTDENGNKLKDAKGHWIAVTEKKAQFVLGYHGYIQLALRTGQYRDMGFLRGLPPLRPFSACLRSSSAKRALSLSICPLKLGNTKRSFPLSCGTSPVML